MFLVIVVFIVVVLWVPNATCQSLWVSPTGLDSNLCSSQSTPCATIQRALNLAPASGSTVNLLPGVYTGTGNRAISFPNKNVNILGVAGSGSTFIDGASANVLFALGNNEAGWIDGVTLTRGKAISGGCVLLYGTTIGFRNSVFHECKAINAGSPPMIGASNVISESGGAAFILNSTPTFDNVTFQYNKANQGAGSVWLDAGANAVFTKCTFQYEIARLFGGSVVPEGNSASRFTDCIWNGCSSVYGGSIDTGSSTTTEFWNVQVRNSSAWRGAAVYHFGHDNLKFYNSIFADNSAADNGGAVSMSVGVQPLYSNCSFISNQSGGTGGVLYADTSASPTFIDVVMRNNSALATGGAMYARGGATITATNLVVTGNNATYAGSIACEDSSTMTFQQLTCTDSQADLTGGCINAMGTCQLSITDAYIAGNTAMTVGGGINVDSSARYMGSNVTVDRNTASTAGGGIFLGGSSTSVLSNHTISNNQAGSGAGLALSALSAATVTTTNFVGNSGTQGGAVFSSSPNLLSIASSILTANRATFGAAIFLDATAKAANNLIDASTVSSNVARAGGAFFYNSWARLLTTSATVTITNNTALYGNTEATRPWSMLPVGAVSPHLSPKDRFSVSLVLVDFFNNTCFDTPEQVIVALQGSAGLAVTSSIPRQGFQNGVAVFDAVNVAGTLGQAYQLTVTANGVPSISFPITISSCGPGYYSSGAVGSSSSVYTCSRCPSGTYSLQADAACNNCPTGGNCILGGANITSSDGFWADPSSLAASKPEYYRCHAGSCLAGDQCAEHHTGRLCSVCAPGYSEWNHKCNDCSTTSPSWLAAPLLAGVFYAYLLIRYPELTHDGVPKSIVFFLQAGLLLAVNDPRLSTQELFKSLDLGFDWLVAFDKWSNCVLNLGPLARIAYNYYSPVTPMLGVIVWVVIYFVRHRVFLKEPVPQEVWTKIFGASIWSMLWGFIQISKTSFNLISCTTIGKDLVLAAAPTITCLSGEHLPYLIGAVIVLCTFVAGLPVLCIWLLLHARSKLKEDPHYPLVRELYESYRPGVWYFEVVLTLRKLLLTILDVFLSTHEANRSLALALFFYLAFLVQYITQPFVNQLTNRVEDFLLMTLLLMSGFAAADVMRTNYQSTLDFIGVVYLFMFLGFILVAGMAAAATGRGQMWIHRFMRRHPILAGILHGIANLEHKLSHMGSAYSIGRRSGNHHGTMGSATGAATAMGGRGGGARSNSVKSLDRKNAHLKTIKEPPGLVVLETSNMIERTAMILEASSATQVSD
ncbi:hypothetical protein BC828DRAFT_384593 [Blastocladiella britannica]|nr:hypothetical protein BC828DRAFT_384593 [Blastocladiella britannica]